MLFLLFYDSGLFVRTDFFPVKFESFSTFKAQNTGDSILRTHHILLEKYFCFYFYFFDTEIPFDQDARVFLCLCKHHCEVRKKIIQKCSASGKIEKFKCWRAFKNFRKCSRFTIIVLFDFFGRTNPFEKKNRIILFIAISRKPWLLVR